MFAAELEGCLKGGYCVWVSLGIEASTLFLQAIIPDARVHTFGDDRGKELISHVQEADGSPVVMVGFFVF